MAKRLVPRPAFSSGQTFAEFMMVVLPTLGLIFGVVSFAMTIYTYSFLSNAARDAVRYAIVHGSKSTSPVSSDDIQTFVRGEAKGINPSSITVTSCWNPQAPPNQCQSPTGNNAPGKVVSVSVASSILSICLGDPAALEFGTDGDQPLTDRGRLHFVPSKAATLSRAFLFELFSATNLIRRRGPYTTRPQAEMDRRRPAHNRYRGE